MHDQENPDNEINFEDTQGNMVAHYVKAVVRE